MITGTIKNKVDKIWTDIWAGGLTNPLTVKKTIGLIITLTLVLSICAYGDQTAAEQKVESEDVAETEAVQTTTEESTYKQSQDGKFIYIHDPRDNPMAMKDIIENPNAVYGFSPNPESERLGSYAQYDWTDPVFVSKAQKNRRAYHEAKASMIDILYEMREKGASIEEMARAISIERNRIRLESYKDDPQRLKIVKESNLKTYGHEEGPTPDQLYDKLGSWTSVIQSAFGTNMGMDACCGLYDEYYWLYRELGYVE